MPSAGTVFRRIFRATRVVVLSVGIYQTGHSAGLIDYATNPSLMDEKLMKTTLASTGADAVYEHHTHQSFSRVHRIGLKVIAAAKKYCEMEYKIMDSTYQNLKNQLKVEKDPTHIKELHEQISNLDEEATQLLLTIAKLDGKWDIVLTNSKAINAFVTEMCPRRIFVNEGLVSMDLTDDEIAFVLSHEISHIICNHNSQRLMLATFLKVSCLVLLSLLDPVGSTSFAIEMMLPYSETVVESSFSRHNEIEADELGLKIAYMARFDPKKGITFMKKLADATGHRAATWSSTHPSSDERFEHLQQKCDEILLEVKRKYK